jgi:DNA-binding response OmpR family regulator
MMDAPATPVRPLILLVDDDAHLLALLANALQASGYDVRLASSAKMAVELLADGSRAPDLALIDMHMPDMNGLQLVHSLSAGQPLPFLMMSASSSEVFVRRAAEQGAVAYLVKPIELAQLVPAVITGIARGREIRALHESETKLTAALLGGRETAMAVGVVMERFHVDSESAFGALRQHARSNQRRLVDVATEFLKNSKVASGIAQRLSGRDSRR